MAGIHNGPARGGTRGGKDQFKWEDVPFDQHSQNYLGHSVKAAHGRWQNNKDLNWAWSKPKLDLKAANRNELKMAKDRDADLMAQMLGEKPMQRVEGGLNRSEKGKLFKKGNAEEGSVQAEIADEDKFGERIQGLGFAPVKIENLQELLETKTHEKQDGIANLLKAHTQEGQMEHVQGNDIAGQDDVDYAALLAGIEGGNDCGESGGSPPKMDKKAKKAMKKAHKAEKKKLKAEKKAKKNKKTEMGKGRRSSDTSDSEPGMSQREVEQARRHREWARGFETRERKHEGANRSRSRSSDRQGAVDQRDRSRDRSRDRQRERSRDRDRQRGRKEDRCEPDGARERRR